MSKSDKYSGQAIDSNSSITRSETRTKQKITDFLRSKPMMIQWISLLCAIIIMFTVFSYINPRFASLANIESEMNSFLMGRN